MMKTHDPYMVTSLLGTNRTCTLNEDDRYIQLDGMKHNSQGRVEERVEVIAEPKAARIIARTDVSVKISEAV
jgi:hypothetical protein